MLVCLVSGEETETVTSWTVLFLITSSSSCSGLSSRFVVCSYIYFILPPRSQMRSKWVSLLVCLVCLYFHGFLNAHVWNLNFLSESGVVLYNHDGKLPV